jgi:hypothetical protein
VGKAGTNRGNSVGVSKVFMNTEIPPCLGGIRCGDKRTRGHGVWYIYICLRLRTVLLDVKMCDLVETYRRFWRTYFCRRISWTLGSTFLWNVGKFLPDFTE